MNQKPAKASASKDGASKDSSQKGGKQVAPLTTRAQDHAQWYIDILRNGAGASVPPA